MVKIVMNLTYPRFECIARISVDFQTDWFYGYGKQILNGSRPQNDPKDTSRTSTKFMLLSQSAH